LNWNFPLYVKKSEKVKSEKRTRQSIRTYACTVPVFVLAGDAVVPAGVEPMMVILAVVGPVFETEIVVLLSVLVTEMVVLATERVVYPVLEASKVDFPVLKVGFEPVVDAPVMLVELLKLELLTVMVPVELTFAAPSVVIVSEFELESMLVVDPSTVESDSGLGLLKASLVVVISFPAAVLVISVDPSKLTPVVPEISPELLAPHFSSSALGLYHSMAVPFQEQVAVTSRLSSATHKRRQVAPSDPSKTVQEVE